MTASQVLGLVLGPSHFGAEGCPEKGNEADKMSGAQVLRGAAKGAGIV